jgi:hypothetical protein
MSLPFFIGGLTWATLALIRLSLAKLLPDPDPNIITTTIVKSGAIGGEHVTLLRDQIIEIGCTLCKNLRNIFSIPLRC